MVSNSSIHTAAFRTGPIQDCTETACWLTERDVGTSEADVADQWCVVAQVCA